VRERERGRNREGRRDIMGEGKRLRVRERGIDE